MDSTEVLGKRKRTQISYAEPDADEFEDDLDDVEREVAELTDDEDVTYDSKKNHSKRTRSQKKRAKLASSRPKKSKPQKPFPFVALPAELRDYIYELALTEQGGVTLVSVTKAQRRTVRRGEIISDEHYYHHRGGIRMDGTDSLPAQQTSLVPNLLAVNKQIHAEATAWLYQQPIILEDTMALHTFIAAIGPANRNAVTDIVVKGWGCGRGTHKAMNVAGMTILADCPNLKRFQLDCDISWRRGPKSIARQLYRDGHYFFERFGAVKRRKDAILDVLQLSECNFDQAGYWGYVAKDSKEDVENLKKAYAAEMKKLLGC